MRVIRTTWRISIQKVLSAELTSYLCNLCKAILDAYEELDLGALSAQIGGIQIGSLDEEKENGRPERMAIA